MGECLSEFKIRVILKLTLTESPQHLQFLHRFLLETFQAQKSTKQFFQTIDLHSFP